MTPCSPLSATRPSKIRSSDDLLSIATLGFRGEALPSIASVARLTLTTREKDEEVGTEIEIAGGKILRVDEAGLPHGTTIAIRDLFFNTPARKKFMKTEQTRADACGRSGHALRARASGEALRAALRLARAADCAGCEQLPVTGSSRYSDVTSFSR